MYSEVKVSNYPGDIGELVRRYSDRFHAIPIGRSDVVKYVLIKKEETETYLLLVSKGEESKPSCWIDYNVIISIIGPREERIQELMEDFQKVTELETKEAPESLKRLFKKVDDMV